MQPAFRSFENKLSTMAIVTADDDLPDDAMERAVRDVLSLTREHLAMDVAFVSHFSNGRRVFKAVEAEAAAQVIAAGSSDPLEATFCQRVIDGRLPAMVRDVGKLPNFSELPSTPFKIGAHLSTGIELADGSIYGTLCTFSFAPNEGLMERDLKRLRMAAAMVAKLIDSARQREHGRESSWGLVTD